MLNTLQHIINQIPIIDPKELRQLRRPPSSLLELARVRVGRARRARAGGGVGCGGEGGEGGGGGDGDEGGHGGARGEGASALGFG